MRRLLGGYEPVDAPLLRASVHTSDTRRERPWPVSDAGSDLAPWRAWLVGVWSQPDIAAAITTASPVVAGRIEAVRQGHTPEPAQVRRLVTSVARYLVRVRRRATPFGLFAGVSALRFGVSASVSWTDEHRTVTRADAAWLAAIIAQLEDSAPLRHRLSVVVNTLAYPRGDRLVVPWQPHASGHHRVRGTRVEVSVPHRRGVHAVLQAARTPVAVHALICDVATGRPGIAVGDVDALVAQLLECGALISSLRAPSTSIDGLAYLLRRLSQVHAEEIAGVAPLVHELGAVQSLLQAADQQPWRDGTGRSQAAQRMRTLAAVEQPLVVDLRLAAAVQLPQMVADEVAAAGDALLRLAPAADPGWRDYHRRFLARFGHGAVVAVERLVDPVAGIGYPRHYAPDGQQRREALSVRDEHLLAVAQRAARDGQIEVVVDDDLLRELSRAQGAGPATPAHVDVCAEIRAARLGDVGEGAFTLAVTGIGRSALATSGRFLAALPGDDQARMRDCYTRLPTEVDGAMAAQVSFPAHRLHAQNVLRAPRALDAVITLAEHPDGAPSGLPLEDLAVTADAKRMYVVSLSRRRVVEPVLTCAAARHTMPPLARLLVEIPQAHTGRVTMFDWGAAAGLPFLPRLRYRRSVLCPARWRITAAELPARSATLHEWRTALTVLRHRLHWPAYVAVGTGDQQLRLDLDEAMDAGVLRAHIDATTGPITVTETARPDEHGWIGDRAHEILVPLARTGSPAPAPAAVRRVRPLPLLTGDDTDDAGRVLFAKLHCHPDTADMILTRHLPKLLAEWDQPPVWWFLRYRHPAPHLRLRIRVDAATTYAEAAGRVWAWAGELRRHGLLGDISLDTYHPETARYGAAAALTAAEEVFAADSAATLAQLTTVQVERDVHPYALTAVSLLDLAAAVTGGRPAAMRWLLQHRAEPDTPGQGRHRDRDLRRQTIALAGLGSDPVPSQLLADGSLLAAAWKLRRDAAARYADQLAAAPTHVTASSVLTSLLHLHHVRVHGVDADTEALTYRLARAVALAATCRRTANAGQFR
ncbi:lantibiotic dehydratase [Actinoplanes sp. NPDC051475]|uniref:lantibiotic dehydratase n=1 Tax=Actinoplanes sp. NPDC051475 TaxID=3157225 RepID=UPI00344ECAD9